MALRRITPRRRPLLSAPRAFFSSNPPFPPPPPPANDPDAAHPPSSSPHPNPGPPRNLGSTLFQDIRERLRSTSTTSPPPRRMPMNQPRPNAASPKGIEDVRRALESFRGSGGPSGPSTPGATASTPGAAPSFLDLLKNSQHNTGQGLPSFASLQESLKRASPLQQRQPRQPGPYMSNASTIFNRELEGNVKGGKEEDKDSGTTLMRAYSYEELGKRLGELRPAGAAKDGKQWFSLEELQGRISKLVQLEKQDERYGGQYAAIRKSIFELGAKAAQGQGQGQGVPMHSVLALGGQMTPDYTRLPPQEELIERYFHPDHMSSEEKMKLELQRVRDEFKMSENDCGSARVQIAQLTLKIKHLSAVLHKKDKHSRKGLQEMVQRRKKYLKYLRRTDWDSYCLVLSKLGLRDVPEYKAPDYKSKSTTKAKSKKSKSKNKKRKMKA
ncbi:unnamed protein product [Urochloa humidicola]